MSAGISLVGGVLKVEASSFGDTVKFDKLDNGTPNNPYDDKIKVTWTHNGQTDIKTFNLYSLVNNAYQKNINSIAFEGQSGNDKVWNNTNLPSTLRGGYGDDELHGGSANDLIEGGYGSDKLFGNGGNDELWALNQSGGTDNTANYLYGGKGDDWLFGADGGVNFLYGGDNDDTLWGGDGGTNFMYGQYGNDTYYAGSFWGSTAFNTIIDSHGSEFVRCGDRALNIVNVVDGGVGINSDDIVIMGTDSNDTVSYDQSVNNGYWTAGDRIFKNWLEYEITINGW
jgi:Ca2+-binding RTX toxin-like protein